MTRLIPLMFPLSFFLLMALEPLFRGRRLPASRWWRLRCTALFMAAGVLNAVVPGVVSQALTGTSLSLCRLLSPPAAVAAGVLAGTLLSYWLHRLYHRVHGLWLFTHQLHHSAERIDLAGASYVHPLEILLNVATTTALMALLGIATAPAMIAGFVAFMLGNFEHLNLRTPRWLGYVIQRPEQHRVHHQRGLHAFNYGLPLWDLLFGTFRNPVDMPAETGFWNGASKKLLPMLAGRDVSQPTEEDQRVIASEKTTANLRLPAAP